jgi:heat shock protein 90kDa beta
MKQIKNAILRHLIQLMNRLEKEEPEKFAELQKEFGSVIKLGATEDHKNKQKLASLSRFHTNQRTNASLDEVCVLLLSETSFI